MLPLILAAVGAAKGILDSKAQQRAQQKNMMANATQMEYSPWTGMKSQMLEGQPSNPIGAAIGGAGQGALAGMMYGDQNKPSSSWDAMTKGAGIAQPGAAPQFEMPQASGPYSILGTPKQTLFGR